MEDNKIIEWLCEVLDDATQDLARRVDAGYVLLNYAARLSSSRATMSDAKVGLALAKSVREKLRGIALDDKDQDLPLEQRIRAAGGAL